MNQIRKFVLLPSSDRAMLAKLAVLLVLIRWGLTLIPFQRLRNRLGHVAHRRSAVRNADDAEVNRIIWAAHIAGRHILGEKRCLAEALAVQFLLLRRGYPTVLRIGVAKMDQKTLLAHAWLEYNGTIIVGGGASPEHYAPLPSLHSETA